MNKGQTNKRAYQGDQQPDQNISPKKQRVVQGSNDLSPYQLIPGNHLPEVQKKREACIWCRWKAKNGMIMINRKNPPQSSISCQKCNAILCLNSERNCFTEYHQKKL